MDSHDLPRPSVPARLQGYRAGVPARAHAGRPDDAAPSPLSVRVAIRGLRRYWWLGLALWAVASAGAGAAIYLRVKPSYRAQAVLRVSPSEIDLYNIRGQGELLDQFLNTQVALVTGANVLAAAGHDRTVAELPRIKEAGDVVQELKKVIQVGIIPGTTLIEVSMMSPSNTEAAVLVNAVVREFIASNGEWSENMTRGQIRKLEDYVGTLKDESAGFERRWKDLVNNQKALVTVRPSRSDRPTEAGEVDPAAKLSIDNYRMIEDQIFRSMLELSEKEPLAQKLRREADAAQRNPVTEDDAAQVDQAVAQRLRFDPEVRNATKAMNVARGKAEDATRKVRDIYDPSVRKARDAQKVAEEELDRVVEQKREAYRAELTGGGPGALDPAIELRKSEAEVEGIKLKIKAYQDQLARVKVEQKAMNTDAVEILLINEKRQHLVDLQSRVDTRINQLRFEQKGEARIRAVYDAMPPGKPISDKRIQYLAMAPVGAFGIVAVLIVLLEIRSARVADTDALSSRVRHEVFAIAPLPSIRPGEDAGDPKAEQRLARFVQSLDHLRVALCEGGTTGEGRCVMITSATGGEGKTTLSAHLAARCANAGTSTLLIDADMRRASLGRLLDVPVGVGLADVLAGEAELGSALTTVGAGGFHFLSAGTPGRDPSRVLKSSRLADLIGQLRSSYDLILIDTPPILPVADALILGRWADGAVMAARYDASRLPLVERANRQLAVAGIPVLGVVVNGARGHDTTYGNYAYSYSYLQRPTRPDDAEIA